MSREGERVEYFGEKSVWESGVCGRVEYKVEWSRWISGVGSRVGREVKMTKMKDKLSKMTVMEVMYDGYSGVGRTINMVGGVVLE